MENLFQEFGQILDGGRLFPLFQPVVSLDEYTIIGYRAILRGPANSPLYSPHGLITTARMSGKLFELEQLFTQTVIRHFARIRLPGLLFKAFPPSYLLGSSAAELVEQLGEVELEARRLVVQMALAPGTGDSGAIIDAVHRGHELGVRVALDEFAAMAMEPKRLKALRPDFITIHPHFIDRIDESLDKQRFIGRLLARVQARAHIIAEGVTTAEAYRTLRHLGLDCAQGEFFSSPSDSPPVEIPKSRFFPDHAGYRAFYGDEVDTIGVLAKAVSHIAPTDLTRQVLQMFVDNPALQSLPVLYRREPVGIIRREHLIDIFLTPYGRDLFGKTAILNFMDQDPLIVASSASIREVSRLIVERGRAEDNQDFIVVKAGGYYGMGRVVDVLHRITEMQIRDASHANPLTGLPGNVRIEATITALLTKKVKFIIGYLDLDHFKPYNDIYGYERGDEVIQLVARLAIDAADPEQDFVGHIGGDDFILIFCSSNWKGRCRRLLATFEERAGSFYNEADRKRGGIMGKDRQGRELFFPLLSLSIGAVQPKGCDNHHCVAAMAAEAKHNAKKLPGNAMFIERRET